jgi:hypothetical protein
MELTDGILLIAASGVGAICGILGQSIKEWLSRPRIDVLASVDERKSAVILYFANAGRKSTEDLSIDIIRFDEGMQVGNEKMIFHTTDLTIHPRTAHTIPFGHSDGQTLRIRKSEFGKIITYADDSDEEQKEWLFRLPVDFVVSACAKDARACVKIMSVDANGVHFKNPKRMSYGMLKQQSVFRDGNNEK